MPMSTDKKSGSTDISCSSEHSPGHGSKSSFSKILGLQGEMTGSRAGAGNIPDDPGIPCSKKVRKYLQNGEDVSKDHRSPLVKLPLAKPRSI